MSLLSNFITNNFISALEREFIAHEPQLQQEFLDETQVFLNYIQEWLNGKIEQSNKIKQANIMKKAMDKKQVKKMIKESENKDVKADKKLIKESEKRDIKSDKKMMKKKMDKKKK